MRLCFRHKIQKKTYIRHNFGCIKNDNHYKILEEKKTCLSFRHKNTKIYIHAIYHFGCKKITTTKIIGGEKDLNYKNMCFIWSWTKAMLLFLYITVHKTSLAITNRQVIIVIMTSLCLEEENKGNKSLDLETPPICWRYQLKYFFWERTIWVNIHHHSFFFDHCWYISL